MKKGGPMSKLKKVDQEILKTLNRQIVLNCIRQHREISRIDLAQYTKLSPTTISTITSELVEKNMINELRIGESSGGRRPIMFGINPQAKYVISIVLTEKEAVCTLINLDFSILKKERLDYKVQNGQETIQVIFQCIDKIMEQFEGDQSDICGIGLSMPGIVDSKTGRVLYSSKLYLEDANLVQMIDERFGIKSFIFKDTDALILGENNFGFGKQYKNFVYLIIENGVGMSYINQGKLFISGYGGGFELGHTTVDIHGPVCTCGNRGCLATLVSEGPAIKKLQQLMDNGLESTIHDTSQLTLKDLVKFSNDGDTLAKYVLEEQAELLGTAIANVINLFNPELVVLGGPLSECKWGFLDKVRNTVIIKALTIFTNNIQIEFSKLGIESALKGMAYDIYKKEIFKSVRF